MMGRLNINLPNTNSTKKFATSLLLTPTPTELGMLLLPAGCSGSGSGLRRLRRPYYDRRFHRLPHPSLLDPPWAWSTEASRRTWATRTRLAAAAAHCLPPNVTSSLLAPEACARPRRRPTAPQQGDRGAAPRLRSTIRRRARHEALCELMEPAIDDRIDRERQIATENPAHSGAALPRSPAQRQRLRREC